MGREVRKVSKNWKHPKKDNGNYQPLFDKSYENACKEWYDKCIKSGGKCKSSDGKEYWFHEWEGTPPDSDYYRNVEWTEEEACCFQMYETVSEGTPLSPVFETKEELVNFLCTEGDFWHKKPWTRKNAESFVGCGFAVSFVVANGKVYAPHEQGELRN